MPVGYYLALAGIAAALGIFGWIWWRGRLTAEQKEQRRRQLVHREGRIIEALVTGFEGETLFYQYSLRGVEYNTAQDCSGLRNLLPDQWETLVGPASCKYQRSNPANSIVLCEEWSGFGHPERKNPC